MMASVPEYNAYAQEVLDHKWSQKNRKRTKEMEKQWFWPIQNTANYF
jgi:hypothetical protein